MFNVKLGELNGPEIRKCFESIWTRRIDEQWEEERREVFRFRHSIILRNLHSTTNIPFII